MLCFIVITPVLLNRICYKISPYPQATFKLYNATKTYIVIVKLISLILVNFSHKKTPEHTNLKVYQVLILIGSIINVGVPNK